jgi:hypothetical protein
MTYAKNGYCNSKSEPWKSKPDVSVTESCLDKNQDTMYRIPGK